VPLRRLAKERLALRPETATRYVNSRDELYLTEGLRVEGNSDHPKSIFIHPDDVDRFVARVLCRRRALGCWNGSDA
jgi:hypothetical protein